MNAHALAWLKIKILPTLAVLLKLASYIALLQHCMGPVPPQYSPILLDAE